MPERVARIFQNGRSQAVRLPAEFRFPAKQVFVSREGERVILSPRPASWDAFFESGPKPTSDFMATRADSPPPSPRFVLMPLFLLDTDICSYIIRERPPSLKERLAAVPIEQQCISVVTYAELVYGVRRSSSQRVNQAVIDAFVSHLDVPGLDESRR